MIRLKLIQVNRDLQRKGPIPTELIRRANKSDRLNRFQRIGDVKLSSDQVILI